MGKYIIIGKKKEEEKGEEFHFFGFMRRYDERAYFFAKVRDNSRRLCANVRVIIIMGAL